MIVYCLFESYQHDNLINISTLRLGTIRFRFRPFRVPNVVRPIGLADALFSLLAECAREQRYLLIYVVYHLSQNLVKLDNRYAYFGYF